MNCKPGDLAIQVSGDLEDYIGNIYRVLRPYDGPWIWPCEPNPSWWVENAGEEFHCSDHCLRPIRDPGDDAQDESLTWLPVPTKEIA